MNDLNKWYWVRIWFDIKIQRINWVWKDIRYFKVINIMWIRWYIKLFIIKIKFLINK